MRNAQVTWRVLRKATLMLKYVPLHDTQMLMELIDFLQLYALEGLPDGVPVCVESWCKLAWAAQDREEWALIDQEEHLLQNNSQVHKWKNKGHLFNNNTVYTSSM